MTTIPIGTLSLREALDRLEGQCQLSAKEGHWDSVEAIRDALNKKLPHFLDAPVRLTHDRLAYLALNGRSVGGWMIQWTVDKTNL